VLLEVAPRPLVPFALLVAGDSEPEQEVAKPSTPSPAGETTSITTPPTTITSPMP